MIIELLELYLDAPRGIEVWIADGVQVTRSFLTGKQVMRMIVKEPKYNRPEYGGILNCMTSDGRIENMAEELNKLENHDH